MLISLVSLRIQTTEANKSDFPEVSPERYAAPPCRFPYVLTRSLQSLCRLRRVQPHSTFLLRQLHQLECLRKAGDGRIWQGMHSIFNTLYNMCGGYGESNPIWH